MTRPNEKTIAFDFDGVLHLYSKGWADGTIYDPPVEGAAQAVRTLLEKNYDLIIHTCRVNEDINRDWVESAPSERDAEIRAWLKEWGFPMPWVDLVEIWPKPTAFLYVDDRGRRFERADSEEWDNLVRSLP